MQSGNLTRLSLPHGNGNSIFNSSNPTWILRHQIHLFQPIPTLNNRNTVLILNTMPCR